MEPEGSLPHAQVYGTCPCPEPDQSTPCPQHPTTWRSILILSSHLSLVLPSGLFPSGLPTTTLYTPLLSLIPATCPTHLILLYWITRIIFVDYRPLSYLECSFLHFPVTSSLLVQNILLKPYSQTLSAYVPPSMSATKFHTHSKQRQNYSSVYL